MSRTPRKIVRVITLLAAIGFISLIWFVWYADGWGLTPERAARRQGYCEDAALVRAQRLTPTRAIVVCQGLPIPSDGGYVYVSRFPWGTWWASPSGANFDYDCEEPSSTNFVDYIHFGPTQSALTSLILLGRSRSSLVTRVEAKLSDGRTLKNEVTNSLFALDAPIEAVGVKVDELKVIGKGNKVLQLIQVKPAY